MWSARISEEINSNQKLRETAEQNAKDFFHVYNEISKSTLKKEIEKLIAEKEEGWLEKVKQLIYGNEGSLIKVWDDDMWLVWQLCLCSEKEREEVKASLLYLCSSLQQISEIFLITVFYLIRIDLDMEEEFYLEFVELIKKWNLSAQYIVMVIKNRRFCDKTKLGKKLVKMLQQQGEAEFGKELWKDIEELGE